MKKNRKLSQIPVFLAIVMVAALLCSCEPVSKIVEVADNITREVPTVNNTITSRLEIIRAMEKSMSKGETELTINVAGVGENELRAIGDYMSTFWGKPTHYTIINEFRGIEDVLPDRAVDIQTITNAFELSNNFYVYDFIKNGTPIPDEFSRAKEVAALLPGIAAEIFTDSLASDFELTLAAHDWLVANLEYSVTTPSISDENSSYGAFVLRRTMCQGYAEALELLLKCYTDVEVVQIVGEATNTALFGGIEGEGGDNLPDDWRGHAWNAVKIDGDWYQVDTTFNDPLGNPTGRVTHFYFGQSDGVMLKNHRWTFDYFPASYAGDFLFYRVTGRFAEDWESFQEIVESMLAEADEEDPVDYIEVAVRGETITEDNIQFIYKAVDDLDAIMWSEQVWNDIHVHSIELVYYS